jgi:hypothetical protein
MDEHGRFYGDFVSGMSEKAVRGKNAPLERHGIFETGSSNFKHLIQCWTVIIRNKALSCLWQENKIHVSEFHLTGKYNVHKR